MASALHIIDRDDALTVTAARKPSLLEAALAAAAAGTCAGIPAFYFVGKPGLMALLIALPTFLYAIRVKNVELRITTLEFVSRGRIGDNFGAMRSVSSHDIHWLEYQEDTTGPETANHPGGLYAVLGRRSICLLPDVDERQTTMLIERIERRFPDFRREWKQQSPFGQHVSSFGLDESK